LKLLFTQDALVNAGAERSHLEILSRFSKETDVLLVYFYPKHELRQAYQEAGLRLIFLDIPERYQFPLAVYRLVRLIRREKPDLLISCLWRTDMITRVASWITGVPLIGTLVNDSYSPLAWTDKKGLKYKLVYGLDRLTSGIPVHWISNAQALADSHVKTLGIKKDKISVVYRGRPVISRTRYKDEAIFQAENSFNQETALAVHDTADQSGIGDSSLAVTGMKRHFLSCGRLLERKGFQDAIHAFAQVLQQYPDCTLTIFGEGPYRTELEQLIQDLGLHSSVFLPGKISNPIEILLSGYYLPTDLFSLITANYFLFPSWYEGFSGTLVEAMMAGIPIIASDIPMNLEAVTDGKTALVFPVKDSSSLAKKMAFVLEHPEEVMAMGQEARREAAVRFDIEKIAREYEAVVRGVLTPPQPSP
jgi:glycosyltransferase involved in cell wall biosynthesis